MPLFIKIYYAKFNRYVRFKKYSGGVIEENRCIWQMLGPLAEESPGGREIGSLGTCEVREIGRLEGPGSGRRSGLPPRTPFFLRQVQK